MTIVVAQLGYAFAVYLEAGEDHADDVQFEPLIAWDITKHETLDGEPYYDCAPIGIESRVGNITGIKTPEGAIYIPEVSSFENVEEFKNYCRREKGR